MKFDSINDIEDYIRDIIGIPYVNLEGVNIQVCNELVNTLEEAFSLYPLLKKAICAIGPSEYINGQINLIQNVTNIYINDGLPIWQNYHYILDKKGTKMTTVSITDENKKLLYNALNIGPSVRNHTLFSININLLLNTLVKHHPFHCKNFKSTIYHELGHILDNILKITEKKEFLELTQDINIKKQISKYATTNEREAFAEAFAEYHSTDEPNDVVRKIVEFGLEEYRRRSEKKSEIFDISRKFR